MLINEIFTYKQNVYRPTISKVLTLQTKCLYYKQNAYTVNKMFTHQQNMTNT